MIACASLHASAALTEAEKNLLTSSISAESATQMGKANDAVGFARIIALGDPELVTSFSRGMNHAEPLPPAIESQIVAHFDDPRVGPRCGRWRFAISREPSSNASIRPRRRHTRTGIRSSIHPAHGPTRHRRGNPSPVAEVSGVNVLALPGTAISRQAQSPGAVDPLIAALALDDQGKGTGPALYLLLHYDSPEVLRKTSEAVERMHADGRLTDNAYKRDRSELDTALKNPDGEATRHRREGHGGVSAARGELNPLSAEAFHLRSDPPRYIVAQATYVAALDAFATKLGDPAVTAQVSFEYMRLGMVHCCERTIRRPPRCFSKKP